MLALGLAGGVYCLLASVSAPHLWLLLPLTFLCCTLGGLLRVLGPAAAIIGTLLSAGFVVAAELPAPTVVESLRYALFFVAGASWAILMTALVWRRRPGRTPRWPWPIATGDWPILPTRWPACIPACAPRLARRHGAPCPGRSGPPCGPRWRRPAAASAKCKARVLAPHPRAAAVLPARPGRGQFHRHGRRRRPARIERAALAGTQCRRPPVPRLAPLRQRMQCHRWHLRCRRRAPGGSPARTAGTLRRRSARTSRPRARARARAGQRHSGAGPAATVRPVRPAGPVRRRRAAGRRGIQLGRRAGAASLEHAAPEPATGV